MIDRNATEARELAARLFGASLATAELMTCYLGLRLGLYDALATGGPATADQLAQRAGVALRYAREWVEQQAAAGLVEVDDFARPGDRRLYALPPGHVEALTQPDSVHFIAPLALLPVGGLSSVIPRLTDAFRSGEGVPWADYGDEFRCGAVNRGIFLNQFPRWIARYLPDVHARLSRDGARVADVACGVGWSSIALARAYPQCRVDGFDRDESVVAEAARHAAAAEVADRASFSARDASELPQGVLYDAICILDALHDMARPVEVLGSCRRSLVEGGSVLLLEPNAAESFRAPANETERFLYAISVLHCLPVGLSEQPSAGTGAVLRPVTLGDYARRAGFQEVTWSVTENRFLRLYRLEG